MAKVVDFYFQALKFLVALCLGSMVLLVGGNVVLRYVFSSGITFSEEFSRWLFVWLTFFGAIVAMKEHTHLGMDSFVSKLSVTGKKICYVLSHLLMIMCCVLLLTGGWDQTLVNLKTRSAATGLSGGLFYGVILVFGASALCILVYDLFKILTGTIKDEDLIQVRESEEDAEVEKHRQAVEESKARTSGASK